MQECKSAGGWDTHGDNFNCLRQHLLPKFDRAFSAFLEDMAAFRAGLRCARWIDLNDYAPSFFRFGVQPSEQVVPSGIEDAL